MDDLENIRHFYAEAIRDVLRRRCRLNLPEALVNAFAKVPRERFLGPGPWLIRRAAKAQMFKLHGQVVYSIGGPLVDSQKNARTAHARQLG
jgi:protein-L-isoaspartate O-methyltransferase